MTPGRYEYCAIYISGLPDQETATDLLARILGGQRNGRTIYGDGLDLDVLANPDHDPGSNAFVRWPIKLEIEFDPATPASRTVNITARLLTCVWDSRCHAVAACDYEDELPRPGVTPAIGVGDHEIPQRSRTPALTDPRPDHKPDHNPCATTTAVKEVRAADSPAGGCADSACWWGRI